MHWNIKLIVGAYFLIVDPLRGLLFGSDATPVPVSTTTSPSPVYTPALSTQAVVSLSPSPVALVESGQPLVLIINIVSNTSWRLEWSTSANGERTLGSAKSSQIGTCQESANMSEACLLNTTSVRFFVEHPRHNDTLYCAVFLPGTWSPTQTRLTVSTEIYMLVPIESVRLQRLSGDIIGDQLIVKEGDNVTLHCETFPCRPEATITWIKDSSDISSLADISVLSADNGLFRTSQNLTMLAERPSHSTKSVVRCNAVSNSSNATSNLLEIVVLSIPVRPTSISVEYINKADVRLTWSIEPESLYRVNFDMVILPDTAGLTIGPHTQQEDVKGTETGPAGILFSSSITGLQANLAYSVSITAYNDVGRSASTLVYIAILSDETEAESAMLYFHVGLALIAVACMILVLSGVGLVIRLKQGDVLQSRTICGLPVTCRSREDNAADSLYEDMENTRKGEAPVIEKRLRNARKTKGGSKDSAGMVSGVYNSIASTLDDLTRNDTPANIYDDIPAGSVAFTSSGSGSATAEGKVTLALPKKDPEKNFSKGKQKPPILKKPPSRKQSIPVTDPEEAIQDPISGETTTSNTTDIHEIEDQSVRKSDQSAEDVDTRCEYMEMRVPEPPKEAEYVDVHRPREEPGTPS